ncbi:MAG: zinc ribbon domain-containing protein [Chloroflexi bacterium]|nr:zinc ribbon domain-containing protein [Chloroflexota bacterium]
MNAEHKIERECCRCPYCDAEIGEASFPFCEACEVMVLSCPKCHKPVTREDKVCPSCGAELKGEEA